MSHHYDLWVGKGQALLGEFSPAKDYHGCPHVKLEIGPPEYPTNEIVLYFYTDADMVTTAQTLRRIAEALERTLWPELEPDFSTLPLGVLGS